MPNMTLSMTEEVKSMMNKYPEVRWSNVVRNIILQKLRDFEEAERLAQKSKITDKDVELISKKVSKDAAKQAKRLLNELYS